MTDSNYRAGAQAGKDFQYQTQDYRRGFMEAALEQPLTAINEFLEYTEDREHLLGIRRGMVMATNSIEQILKGEKTPEQWLMLHKSYVDQA